MYPGFARVPSVFSHQPAHNGNLCASVTRKGRLTSRLQFLGLQRLLHSNVDGILESAQGWYSPRFGIYDLQLGFRFCFLFGISFLYFVL